MKQLFVGVGREVITPEIGTMLQGYTPARPCASVHDDLHITVFAFEYDGQRALFVSADLCNIRGTPSIDTRVALAEAAGIPVEHCILACTHTHSGPHTSWELEKRPNYIHDRLIPAARKAAAAAVAALRPAVMGVGTVHSDVAINRRQITEEGKTVLGQNPYGTYDPTMTVVAFREPDGTPIGNMIHYGCHNTGSGKNDAVTRDWCGVAIDRLEQQSGGITAFFNGCGGDCGPRLSNGGTTGDLSMALELGGRAAGDAVRAWRSIHTWQSVPMRVLHGGIRLPLQRVGTAEQVLEEAAKLGDPEKLKGTMRSSYLHLLERAEYLRAGNVPPEYEEIPHTVISLGSVALLAIPFEPFSVLTLRIKESSPYLHTLCVGYANGSLSYFPSMDQLIRGGYEVRMFRTINLIPYADDSEQHYVRGSLQLLRQLHDQT